MPEDMPLAELVAARDHALRDVERTMIQIVQTSLSMIGFGFTIHAFLNGVDTQMAAEIDVDQVARRLGLALLTLGLLNLAWGIWNQTRHMNVLKQRHPLPPGFPARLAYRVRSTFVIASLLLAVGAGAFIVVVMQALREAQGRSWALGIPDAPIRDRTVGGATPGIIVPDKDSTRLALQRLTSTLRPRSGQERQLEGW